MSTTSAEHGAGARESEQVPVEELARQQGVRPIRSADELARDDVWESDEELDAFLADLSAPREDLWIYTPENFAKIQRGLEDLRAGRLIRMSPDELEAYGDAAEAAREKGDPTPQAG
jgi:hypothetical protein